MADASAGPDRASARPAIVDKGPELPRAVAIMARHGRSFRLAGRLLPRREMAHAAELYAFCRTVDDLADEAADPDEARESLGRLLSALNGAGSHPLAERFAAMAARGVPPDAAAALVATVMADIGPVRIQDEAALLRYAHGAAGTVGVMMCAVLGATNPAATPYAIDLGTAMQLTNIARDVAADAARDRLYLPADWLPAGYGPGDVARDPRPAFAALCRVLALAERRYRGAEPGFTHLPLRVRTAIRAAALLYEAIGPAVLRGGPEAIASGHRAVVPQWQRMALLAGCLLRRPTAGARQSRLHTALRSLPGAHA